MSKLPSLGSSGGMVQTVSRRIVLALLTVALALVGAVAPVRAQSAYHVGDKGELSIQNNRRVPVTVYWEGRPFERELGEVEPMSTATFSIPKAYLREGEMVDLLIVPRGQLALQAKAILSSHPAELALVVPATPHQQRHQEHEMLAWQMQHEPVVQGQGIDQEDDN